MGIIITDHTYSNCPMSSLLFVSSYEFVELSQNCALGFKVDLMFGNEEGRQHVLRRPGPQPEQLSAQQSCSKICTADCISLLPSPGTLESTRCRHFFDYLRTTKEILACLMSSSLWVTQLWLSFT